MLYIHYSSVHPRSSKCECVVVRGVFHRTIHSRERIRIQSIPRAFESQAQKPMSHFILHVLHMTRAKKHTFTAKREITSRVTRPFPLKLPFFGFGQVMLFSTHCSCILDRRHCPFSPFLDHVKLESFSDLPFIPRRDATYKWSLQCMSKLF